MLYGCQTWGKGQALQSVLERKQPESMEHQQDAPTSPQSEALVSLRVLAIFMIMPEVQMALG